MQHLSILSARQEPLLQIHSATASRGAWVFAIAAATADATDCHCQLSVIWSKNSTDEHELGELEPIGCWRVIQYVSSSASLIYDVSAWRDSDRLWGCNSWHGHTGGIRRGISRCCT